MVRVLVMQFSSRVAKVLNVKKNLREEPIVLYSNGKKECNWEGANYITKLEVQIEELTKRISCNPEAHGLIKFASLSTCKCLAAEIFQRDKLIYQLEKENGILRKEKLLRSKK